ELGTRCEIKNLNSLKFLRQAVDYEARRQISILEDGGTIKQETRLYNIAKGETIAMRSKEEAHDYRYFSDPDLPPVVITDALIDEMRATLPELPDAKAARFIKDYGISAYDATVLVVEQNRADYFEQVAKNVSAKLAANWVISELLGRLNKAEIALENSPVNAKALGSLLEFIEKGTISGRIAKDVFDEMMQSGKNAGDIIAEKGLEQISDSGEIEKLIDAIIADSASQLADYRGGNQNLFGWFVGQAMKRSGGKVNPKEVNRILKEKL
ncbi:MAG: Asp-tRNA(Asn)/Glu-tRNA(Gln) amidotransferase GatCAB subunit B, partial [Alphaproteobacteria bacterium]|nr:Asp-tRNA(Asn)/Glu-tRNA(Gln) amidotransferase GatCAB subunit B [Alphaproteobacteria bacterium]